MAGAAINIYNHWGEINQGGKINWGKFAYAGVVGGGAGLAVSLGIGAIAGTAAVATSTAASIASGIGTGVVGGALTYSVQEGLNSLVFKSQFSSRGLIAAAVTGGIFGGIAGIPAVGKALNKFSDKLDDAVETWWRGVPNGGSNITVTAENVTQDIRPRKYWAGGDDLGETAGVDAYINGKYNLDVNIASEYNGMTVHSPNGSSVSIQIPEHYSFERTFNDNGWVFRQPGTTGNSNTIRIMGPTSYAPKGYTVFYNNANQPFDPNTGKTLGKDFFHFLFH